MWLSPRHPFFCVRSCFSLLQKYRVGKKKGTQNGGVCAKLQSASLSSQARSPLWLWAHLEFALQSPCSVTYISVGEVQSVCVVPFSLRT